MVGVLVLETRRWATAGYQGLGSVVQTWNRHRRWFDATHSANICDHLIGSALVFLDVPLLFLLLYLPTSDRIFLLIITSCPAELKRPTRRVWNCNRYRYVETLLFPLQALINSSSTRISLVTSDTGLSKLARKVVNP